MRLILTSVFTLILTNIFSQDVLDGYMKGKGNLDVALSGMMDNSGTLYQGYEASPGGRTTNSLNLFAAYGITNFLDVVASAPYVSVTDGESELQDGSLYLRAKLGETNLASSKLRFMLGAGTSAPLSDYVAEDPRAIGQRATAYDFRGIIQAEFSNGMFAMLQSGYTVKNDPVPNSLPLSARVGYTFDKWYMHLAFSSIHAQSGIDYVPGLSSREFRKLAFSTQNIGVVAYYAYKPNLGFFAGTNQTVIGRNAFASNAFLLGLVWKRNSPKKEVGPVE